LPSGVVLYQANEHCEDADVILPGHGAVTATVIIEGHRIREPVAARLIVVSKDDQVRGLSIPIERGNAEECCGAPRDLDQAGDLECERPAREYGDVANGAVLEDAFVLRNTGRDPVILWGIRSSCTCTVSSLEVGGKRFEVGGINPYDGALPLGPGR